MTGHKCYMQNILPFFSFGSRTPHTLYAKLVFRLGIAYPTMFNVAVSSRPPAIKRDKSSSIWWAKGPLKCINIWMHAPPWSIVILRESTLNIHSGTPITCLTSSINWALNFLNELAIKSTLVENLFFPPWHIHNKFRRPLQIDIFDDIMIWFNICTCKPFTGVIRTK